jgi:hypothetical protein
MIKSRVVFYEWDLKLFKGFVAFSAELAVLKTIIIVVLRSKWQNFCIFITQCEEPHNSIFFGRSIGTVSNHFHRVLRVLISFEDRFLVQPTEETPIPNEILTREGRFYPYFEVPFYPS